MQFDDFLKRALYRALFILSIIAFSIWVSSCSTVTMVVDTKIFTEQYLEVTPKQAERIQKRFKRHTSDFPIYDGKYLILTKEQVEMPKKHLKTSVLGKRYTKQLLN